jgi:deoxyribodipyrimidine photo-lyase
VDAAPYFRVFNMATQARTHDPDGTWLRRWVPECGGCPDPYRTPVVDLGLARKRYLDLARNVLSGDKNEK